MTAHAPHSEGMTDNVVKLRGLVVSQARCVTSDLDPDQWFPVSRDLNAARWEAAAAIAVCASCPVSEQCLELSLRQWYIGQHGIWGGLLPAEREPVRAARLSRVRSAGTDGGPADTGRTHRAS